MKYINVYFTESVIVMKSVERNCNRDLPKREGKMWDPTLSLGIKNKIYVQMRRACPMLVSCNQNVR
jgi:hypothetical protein